MRIVIDMQGAQTVSRFRGIGRYTLDFVKAVAKHRGEHEIILALSNLLPDTIEPIRIAFNDLLPQKNILVWCAPGPVKNIEPGNGIRREVAELIREAFLLSLQPDVIHISSLFEGYVDDAVTTIGRFDIQTPVSVSFYDLIPLLTPDIYLKPNPHYERHYLEKLDWLNKAKAHLAISEHSNKEGQQHLSSAGSASVNVSSGVESCFAPQQISENLAHQVRKRFGITRAFVFCTGGFDERKNLPRLVQAFASLPQYLRKAHQLVFGGKHTQGDVEQLRHAAKEAGLNDNDIVFTGYVSDEELVQLYNLCALYVFPSWYEGFGLPALEAMACGAPVIGANTASLPEVIGLPEALFDPYSVPALTRKLMQVLEDVEFCQRLRDHGQQQAKNFSWDETAKRAIRVWENLPSTMISEKKSWRQITEQIDSVYQRLIPSIASTEIGASEIADSDLRRAAVCLAKNELEIDGFLRPIALPEKMTWRIEGPFDSSYSLALVNREIARGLVACGQAVSLHSTEGPGDFLPSQDFLDKNPDLDALYQRSVHESPLDVDVTSRNLYPPRVLDMQSRLNFLHAYGWEESGFPMQWANEFNATLQGMTVMSEHVRKIMIDHGVTVPVTVSGLGVDHWDGIVPDPDYHLRAKGFRFLHVSSCFPRKGVDAMLRAYGQAFCAQDDVTLVIKTFKNPHNEIHLWLAQARGDRINFPDVIILEEDFSESTLKALYEQCHALVAPSRAEGFGLPMAEAMLSGLSVITTAWSGQVDFCREDTAWLIDYSFSRAQTHFGLFNTAWADPDEQHLCLLMKEVAIAPEETRFQKIRAGQALLRQHFTWKQVASRMLGSAQACAQAHPISEPRIGWVTTWNSRCGIATYSEHLITHMTTPVTILAAEIDNQIRVDQANVRRCWQSCDEDPLLNLMAQVEQAELDVVVVQFNYGFFNFEYLANFLDYLVQTGRVVMVTLHATIDPPTAPHKTLKKLAPALGRCDRVLVHSHADLNRLKQVGVVHNATLFPHGIIQSRADQRKRRNREGTFVLGSYGFFLPHKGLLELIEAVAILREQQYDCRLVMVNAQYPIDMSAELIATARDRIAVLGLSEYVTLCTDFLEDDESLDKLSGADLVVFPYQQTGESASGAVRFGIASGRPVAVTPLPIFGDVQALVHRLPGTAPSDIARGIAQLVGENGDFEQSTEAHQASRHQWLEEHAYWQVGQRMQMMLTALRTERGRFAS